MSVFVMFHGFFISEFHIFIYRTLMGTYFLAEKYAKRAVCWCSSRKLFWKTSQNLACNFIERNFDVSLKNAKCFPVNLVELFRAAILRFQNLKLLLSFNLLLKLLLFGSQCGTCFLGFFIHLFFNLPL